MFNKLDIILLLSFVSTLIMTIISQQPFGPEGSIGAWILILIPCLFVAILVFTMVAKESLDFIPIGGVTHFVIAVGVLITFSIVMFALLGRYTNLVQALLIAIPYLILACCAVMIHKSDFPGQKFIPLLAAILLGGAALTGWGLAGTGIFLYVQKDLERATLRAQKEREQEKQHEQWEVAEYAKLKDSAPLNALLRFTWSRNEEVRQKAREQVNRYPELDDELIELLDQGSDAAISYVANVYENPPAKIAPAWGRMLKRQLKKWDSLQYDEYAGKWEYNLRSYFVGAQKIQLAGGSLQNELMLWHKHLQKCKGLGNLAAFVKNML